MKVEIKDTTNEIEIALRAAGYNVNAMDAEIILNIIDFIREPEKDTTIKDIVEIKEKVKEMFAD